MFVRNKKSIITGHLMTQYALLFYTENQFFNYRLMVHSNSHNLYLKHYTYSFTNNTHIKGKKLKLKKSNIMYDITHNSTSENHSVRVRVVYIVRTTIP